MPDLPVAITSSPTRNRNRRPKTSPLPDKPDLADQIKNNKTRIQTFSSFAKPYGENSWRRFISTCCCSGMKKNSSFSLPSHWSFKIICLVFFILSIQSYCSFFVSVVFSIITFVIASARLLWHVEDDPKYSLGPSSNQFCCQHTPINWNCSLWKIQKPQTPHSQLHKQIFVDARLLRDVLLHNIQNRYTNLFSTH